MIDILNNKHMIMLTLASLIYNFIKRTPMTSYLAFFFFIKIRVVFAKPEIKDKSHNHVE